MQTSTDNTESFQQENVSLSKQIENDISSRPESNDISLSKQEANQFVFKISEEVKERIETLLIDFQPQEIMENSCSDTEKEDVYCGACALQMGKQDNTPLLFQMLSPERLNEYIMSMELSEFADILQTTRHPTRGYTYLHQLSWTYFHEKFPYKNPTLAKQCYATMRFISFAFHHIFGELVNTGFDKEGKENNTPLHEALRDLPNITHEDRAVISLFRNAGLDMTKRDSYGFTINDYIHKQRLDKKQYNDIRNLTRQFKQLENNLYDRMKSICPEHFELCKGCGKEMFRNHRILTFPDSIMKIHFQESDIFDICDIIQIRKAISDIYQQDPTSRMRANHDYVVQAWLQKLHQWIQYAPRCVFEPPAQNHEVVGAMHASAGDSDCDASSLMTHRTP